MNIKEEAAPTPRTKAIMDCVRKWPLEADRERGIALREAAECAIEEMERELAARDARIVGLEREMAVRCRELEKQIERLEEAAAEESP